MLRIGRLTDHAGRVMCALASASQPLVSAQALAQRTQLEPPTVAKLLKTLARAGLVEAQRGVAGGYRLARPAAAISLADIVVAMEGPIGMTPCSLDGSHCNHQPHCPASGPWRSVNQFVEAALRSVSLADMVGPLRRSSMPPAGIPVTLMPSSAPPRDPIR